jgi:hypothetical protein
MYLNLSGDWTNALLKEAQLAVAGSTERTKFTNPMLCGARQLALDDPSNSFKSDKPTKPTTFTNPTNPFLPRGRGGEPTAQLPPSHCPLAHQWTLLRPSGERTTLQALTLTLTLTRTCLRLCVHTCMHRTCYAHTFVALLFDCSNMKVPTR